MVYGYDRIWQLIEMNYIELELGAKRIYNNRKGHKDDFVTSCNCDLRIGDHCYLSDNPEGINKPFLEEGSSIKIQPMGIMLFETEAIFHIPKSYAFRLSLRMSYYKKGLFMPNLPLCRPGYNGRLYGVIMNMSNDPVEIHRRERMLTLEVVGIDSSTDSTLRHFNQCVQLENEMDKFASNAIKSTFHEELKKSEELLDKLTKKENDLKKTIERHTKFQMALISIITIIVALIALTVTIITIKAPVLNSFVNNIIDYFERLFS